MIDCAGLRLQEATDALEAFGEIYLKQTLASGLIPQITAVSSVPAVVVWHLYRH
ncbi:MAG: carboxyl transferase domain-containing protein [Ruminococcus sp.]